MSGLECAQDISQTLGAFFVLFGIILKLWDDKVYKLSFFSAVVGMVLLLTPSIVQRVF